ncbi:uncharacterized protein [Haliotis cracherodii]|uniref:uncharacterized protein n=1 Tax=Haliotis cracherodii TaxID=6455 RepID=UPI0039EAAE7A
MLFLYTFKKTLLIIIIGFTSSKGIPWYQWKPEFVLTYEPSPARTGSSVSLTCQAPSGTLLGRSDILQWKHEDKIFVNVNSNTCQPVSTRLSCKTDYSRHIVTINISNVTMADSGLWHCKRYGIRQQSNVVQLNVTSKVSPKLLVSVTRDASSFSITCHISGDYDVVEFKRWLQYYQNALIREIAGQKINRSSNGLTIYEPSFKDDGVYVCTAEYWDDGSYHNLTRKIPVDVKAPPRIVNNTQDADHPQLVLPPGESFTIDLLVLSKSPVSYTFFMNGQAIEMGADDLVRSVMTPSEMMVLTFGQNVTKSGYKVSLIISDQPQRRAGLVTMSICNSEGCAQYVGPRLSASNDDVTDRPDMPKGFIAPVVVAVSVVCLIVVVALVAVVAFLCRQKRSKVSESSRIRENTYDGMYESPAEVEMKYQGLVKTPLTHAPRVPKLPLPSVPPPEDALYEDAASL